jgi:hypothetical protein
MGERFVETGLQEFLGVDVVGFLNRGQAGQVADQGILYTSLLLSRTLRCGYATKGVIGTYINLKHLLLH